MNRISVYLNPAASSVEKIVWKKEIQNQLFRSELFFRTPRSAEELRQQLQHDVEMKIDTIISIGGDGTVHLIIQSLANSNIPLLVIPGGTANDLATELGHLNHIRESIWCIRLGQTKKLDLLKVNGRYMVTNGGLGMAGEVALKINRTRKRYPSFKKLMERTGKGIYSAVLGIELIFSEMNIMRLQVDCDQFKGEVETPLFMINNQPIIAGKFNIAPYTSNSDGTFNVTIFKHRDRASLVKSIISIARGKFPSDDPHLFSFETRALRIENLNREQDFQFFGDGEIFRKSHAYEITLEEKALVVYEQSHGFCAVESSHPLTDEDRL